MFSSKLQRRKGPRRRGKNCVYTYLVNAVFRIPHIIVVRAAQARKTRCSQLGRQSASTDRKGLHDEHLLQTLLEAKSANRFCIKARISSGVNFTTNAILQCFHISFAAVSCTARMQLHRSEFFGTSHALPDYRQKREVAPQVLKNEERLIF